jgi:nicotinate-nucleotide adenylyltransferase
LPGPHAGLRIGLFGGSFNPAHDGHLHVAETALHRLQLDWIWWIVARGNPLKERHGVLEARLASARAMADHPRMRVTMIEAELAINYTRDLLPALAARAPEARFVWIMGADNLAGFHRWGGWSEIAETLPIAVIARPNAGPRARLSKFARRFAQARIDQAAAASLADQPAPAWLFLTARWHPASSTALRRRARTRNPFRPGGKTNAGLEPEKQS